MGRRRIRFRVGFWGAFVSRFRGKKADGERLRRFLRDDFRRSRRKKGGRKDGWAASGEVGGISVRRGVFWGEMRRRVKSTGAPSESPHSGTGCGRGRRVTGWFGADRMPISGVCRIFSRGPLRRRRERNRFYGRLFPRLLSASRKRRTGGARRSPRAGRPR